MEVLKFFQKERGYQKVAKLLEGDRSPLIQIVNFGEIIYRTKSLRQRCQTSGHPQRHSIGLQNHFCFR
jgi:PIN domain nuclease of toxin-antitoxin system